ncbi:MAG: HlyD family secretion protein [Phycisphaerae bacterium]|jgi:HlyD family secretion protein
MIRTILIPLLAIVGIVFAAITVVKGSVPPPAMPPVIEPPRPPYDHFVAGSGLVEAASENIAVGAPVSALVTRVFVDVNEMIKQGDPLFALDTRELDAQMKSRKAALDVAKSQLAKLEAGTRPETIPPQRARVAAAEADVADARAQLLDAQSGLDDAKMQNTRAQTLGENALSAEERSRRQFSLQGAQARVSAAESRIATAEARLAEARASLALLEAGTWSVDIDVAKSQVAEAQAAIDALQIEIDRRTVKSPVTGKVLQKNVREGEFAQAGALSTPLMLVGTVNPLHVRVDVDEFEAWRVKPNMPAVAFARGNKDIRTDLKFVRFEPFIVPKRSLTGASTERVDTRVLQAIFSFDPKDLPLYVGQQVDVYIKSEPVNRSTASAAPESN